MKIIFNDGTEKECIQVNSSSRYVQGANRECFEFHFNKDAITFAELDNLFYDDTNTKKIILDDGINQRLYENYSIRVELKYIQYLITPGTDIIPDIYEPRFMVTMAQKTYAEMKQEALQETVDVLVLESLGV